MKKLKTRLSYIFCILLIVGFTSCNGASDSLKCKNEVAKEFPEAISISKPTNENYRFVVIDADSSVWYVETMSSTSPRVTEKERLFSLSDN